MGKVAEGTEVAEGERPSAEGKVAARNSYSVAL